MTNGAGWGSEISSLHLIISVLSMIRVYRFVHINTVLHSHMQPAATSCHSFLKTILMMMMMSVRVILSA